MPRTIAALAMGLLLLAVPMEIFGQARTAEQVQPPTITVRGQAEVAALPDLAIVRAGATIQQPSADAAHAQVNQVMQRAIQAITALNVPADQIRTTGVTLVPVYTSVPPPGITQPQIEPRIVGYRASNTVEVRVENLRLLGQVIDAAVAAGANQLDDLSFQIQDDVPYRQEALSIAVRRANIKAQAIAQALGLELLGVQQVQEAGIESVRPTVFARQAMLAAEAAPPTPVEPGEVHLEANVVVIYLIGEGINHTIAVPGTGPAPTTQP